jgi:glycosyltransferase involved in cell wall biosynthesis
MKKIRVSCLPVAGRENPYQNLMIQGLRENQELIVRNGCKGRFFGILKTAVFQWPDFIHFDWETSYYYRRNRCFITLNIPWFFIQILIVKYLFRCKLVWTPHNVVPHDAKFMGVHKLCRCFFAREVEWIRLFDADTFERATLELRVHSSKFIVVPEGSYVNYYTNNIDSLSARKLLDISNEKKVLLYFGLIKPYKGILDLLISFRLMEKKADYELLIVGKSMDSNYLEELVKNVCPGVRIIEGFVQENEVQNYFNAADIVVLPFEKIENSGSVILAMGFGKPIVAPSKGVLSKRLAFQIDLLYSTDRLDAEALNKLNSYSIEKLTEKGKKNKESLEVNNWSDFGNYFRKI